MTRPTPEEVETAIQKATDGFDADTTIHAILPTGDSQFLHFYLVVWEVPHGEAGTGNVPPDATLLKERYFQIPKPDAPDALAESGPTWKRNGIARRNTGDLKQRLLKAYAAVSGREGCDDDLETLWLDDSQEDS